VRAELLIKQYHGGRTGCLLGLSVQLAAPRLDERLVLSHETRRNRALIDPDE